MVKRVEVNNYKCLREVRQDLGRFQILVGPNASGKSTFLDVFSFVRDLLDDGVEEAVESRVGSLNELVWMGKSDWFEIALELEVPDRVRFEDYRFCRYEVRIGVGKHGVEILRETLWLKKESGDKTRTEKFSWDTPSSIVKEPYQRAPLGWRKVVQRGVGMKVYFRSERTEWNAPFRISPKKAGLSNLPEDEERFPVALWARRLMMDGVHSLMLNSQRMREPCRPDAPKSFQVDGSNLPLVLRQLKEENPERFRRWLSHVKLALPNIEDIVIREREVDRFVYLEVHFQGGLRSPSWMLSDGTLRFLALTLLAYIPSEDKIYLIEEPENGIHPRALELVYQSLSSIYDGQVFIATHSPLLLKLAEQRDLLCFTLSSEGASVIVRGDEHPILKEWRGEVDLGELLAGGILG
jgi:predicted ATPase